jgi:hypothetical protein
VSNSDLPFRFSVLYEPITMNMRHIFGVLLLVAGAALLYFGYQSSQTLGEQVYETFVGRFTEATTWYLVAGAAASVCGLVMLAIRGGSRA